MNDPRPDTFDKEVSRRTAILSSLLVMLIARALNFELSGMSQEAVDAITWFVGFGLGSAYDLIAIYIKERK
jgi:hypothetical protein